MLVANAATHFNVYRLRRREKHIEKMLLERGYVAVNPAFDKLITSLRTAVAEENILDKECTLYADVFDAYRLALKHYKFTTREI